MCSIAYFNKKYLTKINWNEYLDKVEDRGLDSLGIFQGENVLKIMSKKKPKKVYRKFLEENVDENKSLLVHLRKASIGSKTLQNAHPYEGQKFVLAQNGTMSEFNSFIELKQLLENKDYTQFGTSDSAKLLAYIEENTQTIYGALDILQNIALLDNIGIVFLYEKSTGKALIFSDTARQLFVKEENGFLIRAENYKDEVSKKKEKYLMNGYIIFNFNSGKILKKDYKLTKKENPTTAYGRSWRGSSSTSSTSYTGSTYYF